MTNTEQPVVPDEAAAVLVEGYVQRSLPRLREWGISQIRTTIVPPLVAALITWLASRGFDVDDTWVYGVLFGIANFVWYGIMRGIEIVASSGGARKIAGVLLGAARPPVARVSTGTPNVEVVPTDGTRGVLKEEAPSIDSQLTRRFDGWDSGRPGRRRPHEDE